MDSIYLRGSEDVQRAGHTFQNAADDMQRAANQMDCTLTNFITQFEYLVIRLEALTNETKQN